MSPKSGRKESKFGRYMYGPVWVLGRARDFYMKSLTGFGGPIAFGNAMGCPAPTIQTLPRSFSVTVNSNPDKVEEDLRDLIRLGSARRHQEVAELRRSKSAHPFSGGRVAVPEAVTRSNTVGFGRIDEDKIFEFGKEDEVGLLGRALVYPRARSYAAGRSMN